MNVVPSIILTTLKNRGLILPCSRGINTSPSTAGGAGLIPGGGAKTPHARRSKNQNIKQKQYCSKFNKDFKTGSTFLKKNLKKKKMRSSIPHGKVTSQLLGHFEVATHRCPPRAGRHEGKRLGGSKLAGQLLPLRRAGTVTPSPWAQPVLPDILSLHWGRDAPPPGLSLLWGNMDSSPLTSC